MPLILKTGYPDLVVSAIEVQGNEVRVTVTNNGSTPVDNPFWVDLYIDPAQAPTRVNQQWWDLGPQGVVWGIIAVPLEPGQSLILTVGDQYYSPSRSHWVSAIPSGAALYAQVDSVNFATTYGAVLERHEANQQPYNNITRVLTTHPIQPPRNLAAGRDVRADELPDRPLPSQAERSLSPAQRPR
jgi:hypothetical protein